MPDADDTAAALLALKVLAESSGNSHPRPDRARPPRRAVAWLLDLQNDDGGWPTFCRGWGALPFDRSGCDLTAHALRALHAWKQADTAGRADEAIERGLAYLAGQQRGDGSWVPLWFGNQHFPDEENPDLRDRPRAAGLSRSGSDGDRAGPAGRRVAGRATRTPAGAGAAARVGESAAGGGPSVEETALAVEALLAAPESPAVNAALEEGLAWLVAAVNGGGTGKQRPSVSTSPNYGIMRSCTRWCLPSLPWAKRSAASPPASAPSRDRRP